MINRRHIDRIVAAAAIVATLGFASFAAAQSRVKDIVEFEGVRDNLLVGYGLVVWLNGTGDTLANAPFTQQSLIGMLERLGVNIRDDLSSLKTDNVAAVMVTAVLPPFARQGARMDVTVSALGDAASLLGGMLLVTPVLGADGEVYAVAQGPLVVGGFAAGGEAETVIKGVPTSARIANGAIVEREIDFDLAAMKSVGLSLRNPDFTTARRLRDAINDHLGVPAARATDPATVRITVPANYRQDIVGLITEIEQLTVIPDQLARVVIDEQSGIIVMRANVRISTVAIAQGNLTIRITETPQVSQPAPLANQGETQLVDRTNVAIDDMADRRLTVFDGGVTLHELVSGLNALGIGPRDMISILQAVKVAGALQAELEVM